MTFHAIDMRGTEQAQPLNSPENGGFRLRHEKDVLHVRLPADLRPLNPDKAVEAIRQAMRSSAKRGTVTLTRPDSSDADALAVAFSLAVYRLSDTEGWSVSFEELPEAMRKLVTIAVAVPPRGPQASEKDNVIVQLGKITVEAIHNTERFIGFFGRLASASGRFLTGRARLRAADFWINLQDCGVAALPIVALISILVGVILAFVGAIQLAKFGATIYVVDLVGIAMAREMGCIMTGVIMSGRTGAAFAAQIGSMNVNEEVDAFETLGISPMEYLVLPRVFAMILMMPLLTLMSDMLGCLGGFIVALPMGISPQEYWTQLIHAMTLGHIAIGIVKSCFFGVIIAASGCYYGMISGRNSAAVGNAATKAVVAGITWIIVLDAFFAFAFQILNI